MDIHKDKKFLIKNSDIRVYICAIFQKERVSKVRNRNERGETAVRRERERERDGDK